VQVQVPEGAVPGTQIQVEAPEAEPEPESESEPEPEPGAREAGASERAKVHDELSAAFDCELSALRASAVAALGGLHIPSYETSIGTKAALVDRAAIKVSGWEACC
jgi:hypothetical protein